MLGAPAHPRPFDRIARIAAIALRAPMAVVTLPGDDEQQLVAPTAPRSW